MNPVNDWVGSSRQGGWGALDFDGSDDRVSLAGLNSRLEGGIGGLAVAAWIYPTQTGNNDPIVSKATNSFGSGDFIVARSTSATARFLIDNGTQVVLSAGSLPQGQWGHIAASWSDDDNTARVFANGVQVATGTMDGAFTSATADLLVGQFYSDFNGLRFTGQMDDVRIWNRGLTPFEMQQVYDRSKQFNPGLLNRATVPGVLAGVAGTPLMFAYHYNDK